MSAPPPGARPGNMAASVLASTSYSGAKFKFTAILSGRNPGAQRGWRRKYPLLWSADSGVTAPWRRAPKVSMESRLRDLVPAPKCTCDRLVAPGRPQGSAMGVNGRGGLRAAGGHLVSFSDSKTLMDFSFPSVYWAHATSSAQF